MTKKTLVVLTILGVSLFAYCQTRTSKGVVTRVLDGDTYEIDGDTRVRLYQADAPELAQPFGKEARDYVQKLIGGKTVKLEWHGKDKYGRRIAEIYVEGLQPNLSYHLLRNGYAWAFGWHIDLKKAQQGAAAANLGLWAYSDPQEPYYFRQQHRYKEKEKQ